MAVEYDPNGTPILTNDSLISDVPPYTQALAATGVGGGVSGIKDSKFNDLQPADPVTQYPVGVVQMWSGWYVERFDDYPWSQTVVPVPNGWLLCDGRTYDPDYFTALHEVCPAFKGGSTFRVPDLRGRMPVGMTFGLEWDGDYDRPIKAIYTPGEMHGDWRLQRHMHYVEPTAKSNEFNPSGGDDWYCTFTPNGNGLIYPPEKHRTTYNIPAKDGAYGLGENMPPYTAINFIIYTGKPTLDENGDILPECGQGPEEPYATTRQMIEQRLAEDGISEDEVTMLREQLEEIKKTEAK